MLGKIFTVCLLVSVSACLVRSQPAGQEKIAGIADDVATLLSKLGAKSTDEAVAKIWAKGDDISKAEQENLVKLLKSSDGAAALAALQRPVTSKLARLDNMVAEYKLGKAPEQYRKAMLADMDKTVDEINAALGRYDKIFGPIAPDISYKESSVLEMMKIVGIKRLRGRLLDLTEKTNTEDTLKAFLFIRNHEQVVDLIRHRGSFPHSLRTQFDTFDTRPSTFTFALQTEPIDLQPVIKMLNEGDLEDDVYPLYNEFLSGARPWRERRLMKNINVSLSNDLDNSYIISSLEELEARLIKRNKLLDISNLSATRRATIETESQRFLTGAGEDGSKTLDTVGGMSGWAKTMKTKLLRMKEIRVMRGGDPAFEMVEVKKADEILERIAKLK